MPCHRIPKPTENAIVLQKSVSRRCHEHAQANCDALAEILVAAGTHQLAMARQSTKTSDSTAAPFAQRLMGAHGPVQRHTPGILTSQLGMTTPHYSGSERMQPCSSHKFSRPRQENQFTMQAAHCCNRRSSSLRKDHLFKTGARLRFFSSTKKHSSPARKNCSDYAYATTAGS